VYQKFQPYRSIRGFLGQSGNEANELILPNFVLDSHAHCLMNNLPEEYVVTGKTIREIDGMEFLRFAATREYIEATTDFRDVPGEGLIYVCPECEGHSGKHSRSCKNG
jgi:hypothetical protein